MFRKSLVTGLFVVVTVAACAENAVPDSATEGSIDSAQSELTALIENLDAIRNKANIAGAGIAIVSKDEVIYAGGLGVQSLETLVPATGGTLFRLGSITKSFVGLTALTMGRDNPSLFEQPVNKVVPELLGEEYDGNSVRLPHLLEHTAGLGDLGAREFAFQGETVAFKEAVNYDPETRKLRWPAAAHSSYSNAGFGFAGYVLETAAKRPFEALVRDHVLNPLGMDAAGFFITDKTPPLATGYNTDGVTRIPYWHMLYRSFGGLNATPSDMSRFVQALLQPAGPGEIFVDATERRRYENPSTTLAASTGLDYGYGLGNYHWFSNGLRFHGHGGDADGYLSHFGYSTEAGYGYFVVITAFNKKPLNQMRVKIEQYIASLPRVGVGQGAPDVAKPVALPMPALSKLAGDYVEVTRRFGTSPSAAAPALRVAIKDKQLETFFRGNRLPMVALSAKHFKRPWQPGATYAFITTEGGDVYLQGDMGNFRRLTSIE